MQRKILISTLFVLACNHIVAPIAIAQSEPQGDTQVVVLNGLNRAKNYARQAAERANGGLSSYSAEFAMHGTASDSPHVVNPDGSWTFNFTGTLFGPTPAADSTIQSIVTVTPSGEVRVDYNGPVR